MSSLSERTPPRLTVLSWIRHVGGPGPPNESAAVDLPAVAITRSHHTRTSDGDIVSHPDLGRSTRVTRLTKLSLQPPSV